MALISTPRGLRVLLFATDSRECSQRHTGLRGYHLIEVHDARALARALGDESGDVLVVCDQPIPEECIALVHRIPVIVLSNGPVQIPVDAVLPLSVDGDILRECIELLCSQRFLEIELDRMTARVQEAAARGRWRGGRQRHGLHELRIRAMTDALTGIACRRHFEELLLFEFEQARTAGTPLSVLLIDLDRFKPVNDTWGHSAGDLAIVEVARRLAASVRGTDLVCRYGGDEFALVAPGTTVGAARQMAERLGAALSQPAIAVGEHTIVLNCSIGIASLPESGATSPQALMAEADEAMRAAKRRGGHRVCHFAEVDPTRTASARSTGSNLGVTP